MRVQAQDNSAMAALLTFICIDPAQTLQAITRLAPHAARTSQMAAVYHAAANSVTDGLPSLDARWTLCRQAMNSFLALPAPAAQLAASAPAAPPATVQAAAAVPPAAAALTPQSNQSHMEVCMLAYVVSCNWRLQSILCRLQDVAMNLLPASPLAAALPSYACHLADNEAHGGCIVPTAALAPSPATTPPCGDRASDDEVDAMLSATREALTVYDDAHLTSQTHLVLESAPTQAHHGDVRICEWELEQARNNLVAPPAREPPEGECSHMAMNEV